MSADDEAEPMVETIDAVDGLPDEEARTLSKRMWYLGWCGLPWMWFVNAYFFWPHLLDVDDENNLTDFSGNGSSGGVGGCGDRCPRPDPVIRKYAYMSWRGAQAAGMVVVAWAFMFMVGGMKVFGEETWTSLSVTTQAITQAIEAQQLYPDTALHGARESTH
mmetsp:Transcript_11232/g.27358  ORF Transcript_11232/g.27358 Transcript_11232/m.27358 type:complete len:162 (+) Transcript_11232:306-791(+)